MRRPPLLTRILAIGILLHVYIGLRLIPDAPVPEAVQVLAALRDGPSRSDASTASGRNDPSAECSRPSVMCGRYSP